MSRNVVSTPVATEESFDYPPWILKTVKNHILPSKSPSSTPCSLHHEAFHQLSIPHLPDMVFPDNILRIQLSSGAGIEFNALDALKLVNDKEDSVKVAIAEAWNESRADMNISHKVSHPFDWTFTTDYRGTVLGNMVVTATDLNIDMDKLKQKEKILFFDEIHLYEDELADHGCASFSIKVRVMPSGFFVLLRFYLRVDDVLIRINDTRLYYEKDNQYMLREYTSKESKTKDLKVPRVFWGDPNEISQHLSLVRSINEKLEF
ncbi:TIP41-like protein [Daphnia carinata]|uniref:TIP41-like protein n=1 Tax=Daphnia carinata TaxID=120202 RepID=UPI00257A1F5A|nr:TIP41-like protein [Daphnia carinata]